MIRTLDEFRAQRPAESPERLARTAAALEGITREAVRMEALTGNPEWDHFLSYLEAAHKAALKHREFEFAKLRDPLMVNADEIALCKAKLAVLDGRITALDEIIALPKFITDHAQRAAELIAQMQRDAA